MGHWDMEQVNECKFFVWELHRKKAVERPRRKWRTVLKLGLREKVMKVRV
jgi:hypothetical protein